MKISTGKCNYCDAANMYSSSEAPTRLSTRLNGQKEVACLFVWMVMHIVKKVKAQCVNKIKQDASPLSGLQWENFNSEPFSFVYIF